jgi:hypothetical protein
MRLDANLGGLVLESSSFYTLESTGCDDPDAMPILGTEEYYTMPEDVMALLPASPTVLDLYNLANRGLGGENLGCQLSKITTAVDNINKGMDECRFIYFMPIVTAPISGGSNNTFNTSQTLNGLEDITMSVVPNPFKDQAEISYMLNNDSRVSLEVYNLQGVKVATIYEGEAKAGYNYTYRFDPVGNNSEQVFLVVLRTNFGTITKRIINTY